MAISLIDNVWLHHLKQEEPIGKICRSGIAYSPAYSTPKETDLKPLVCKCCGGKVDRATMTCYYCDTEYTVESITESKPMDIRLDTEKLYKATIDAINDYAGIPWDVMTPNEARKAMGLGYKHAYDTAGHIIKSFGCAD